MNSSWTIKPVYYTVNKDWYAKPLPKIIATGVNNRLSIFLRVFWHDYKYRKSAWDRYGIKPEVVACIAWADSGLGKALKSSFNYGNVGNTDSWKVVHFKSAEQGIGAIAQTLNGKYLGRKQTIGDLSYAWNCKIDCDKVYATSNSNRETNVRNCLKLIHKQEIWPEFAFRQ